MLLPTCLNIFDRLIGFESRGIFLRLLQSSCQSTYGIVLARATKVPLDLIFFLCEAIHQRAVPLALVLKRVETGSIGKSE